MKLKVLKRLVLKEEFVAVTGELESALLLSQLCYWSERVKDFDEFLEEECEAFHGNEELRQKLKKHGWIRKSATELAEEMHWAMQGRTIQRYLLKLTNLKLVDRRRQQNPKYKFDRSCEYRVNFCELQRQLKRIGYNLSDYRVTECFDSNAESNGQIDQWSSNSDYSVGSSDQTITEIRTEINLKNTIESSAESSAPLSHSTDSSSDLFPPDQPTADAKASIATAQQERPPMALKSQETRNARNHPPRKPRQPKLADDAFIAQLAANNPRIDMDTELRKMNNWLLSHPNRQKTRAFVTNWINRVVDKLPEKEERFADF